MDVARTIKEVHEHVSNARSQGRRVGFVPTMGALHAGHFSLVEAARKDCDFVVVSIFVNPTQFGPDEDFRKYPRDTEADLAACRDAGVDLVFTPAVETIYPLGKKPETISPGPMAENLCGQSRPGHFDGVCTVVARLLDIVKPDKVYFGAKDYQQAAIIRRMVRDRSIPVDVVTCPIVREADGLAMSSRNAYLSPDHRRQAAELYKALQTASEMIRSNRPPAEQVIRAISQHMAVNSPAGEIDYVQIVNPDDLTDVENTDKAVLIAIAVRFGQTRLIDNILVD